MNRSLVLVLLLGVAGVASAQPVNPSSEDARAASAKAYFERGDAHFKAGRYLEARAEFSGGYELSHRPLFLFNMAECSRLNGDLQIAKETYERYLREAPTGSQVGLARQRLQQLNQPQPKPAGPEPAPPKGAAPAPAPAPVAAPTPAPAPAANATAPSVNNQSTLPRPAGPPVRCVEGQSCWPTQSGRTKKLVGIGAGAAGGVMFLAGIYFWRRSASLGDEVTKDCADGCDWAAVKGKYEASQSAERKQWGFIGFGLAAAAVGGVFYYLGVREDAAARVAVGPMPGGGAAISWGGRW